MEQLSDVLRMFMIIIGIIQFLFSLATWYLGMQIRMLRMELMSRKDCDARHQNVKDNIEALRHQVGILDTQVKTHLHTKD